jgi:phosphotransferase system enzyme I (PtsP)
MDHIALFCDIGELDWVFSDSTSVDSFLQKTVEMVARHMEAEVCSIYLYDESAAELVLRATVGLNHQLIGSVRLGLGEGLTGMALKELRPISTKKGSTHPNYKFFSGLLEEHYESFLAVPILRGLQKIGVLVVQRRDTAAFDQHETEALRAVSNQLANIIEYARALLALEEAQKRVTVHPRPLSTFYKGRIASTGFALGPVTVILPRLDVEEFKSRSYERHYGVEDFEQAVRATIAQLEDYQHRLALRLSDVASLIFAAHMLMLKDEQFTGRILGRIRNGENAPLALVQVAEEYIEGFSRSENPYMREKSDDIRDLTLRIMHNLTQSQLQYDAFEGHVIVAKRLLPSDLLIMSAEKVAGIVMVSGGVTSHLSILARSLGIPMLVVDEPALLNLENEEQLLIDGDIGNVYINPIEDIVRPFRSRETARLATLQVRDEEPRETATRDGVRVQLLSNINLLSDVTAALKLHAEGVGLYRTEFPFIVRNTFPTEEEQYLVYRRLVEDMVGRPITFRTLDVGGDKALSYYSTERENNPLLGMRSIRFTLANEDIFVQQLRAILRAGVGADIGLMFPMIASLDEFASVKRVLRRCLDALDSEGLPHNAKPRIGIMVELPALLDLIDECAQQVDFLSLGTNDLVQYLLGVDRTNEKVAAYYLPHHPAVLRALKRVADAARRYGVQLSVCGDMAQEKRYLPFLLGIGIQTLSVEPHQLPAIRRAIGQIDTKEAALLAGQLLSESSIERIEALLK